MTRGACITQSVRGLLLAAVLFPFASGCIDLLAPLPAGAVPLFPVPEEYQGWWSLAQRCSGLRGELGEVDWYVVPTSSTVPDSDGAAGTYYTVGHRIVLARGRQGDGYLVRHEMLHALKARDHPRGIFLEQCGGIVQCSDRCVQDAGTAPQWNLGAPPVAADELSVSVDVVPDEIRLTAATPVCVTIAVTVENPFPHAVTVDVRRGRGIMWAVDGWGSGSGGGPVLTDSLLAIEAGGSWTYAFDCPVFFAQGLLGEGTYAVRGRVMGARSDAVTLLVLP
jgi:hypothetical protein